MTSGSLISLSPNDSQVLVVNCGLSAQRSHLSTFSEQSRNLPSKAWSFSRKKLHLNSHNAHEEDHIMDETGGNVTDYVYEHQRGLFLLGYPFFSGNMLMPLDPPNWATLKGAGLYSLDDFALPDITWEWLWNRWYVDMEGDVDDQGWAYSVRFGGFHWYGAHRFFRSFVRRRKWKRLRCKHSYDEAIGRKRLDIRPSFDVRSSMISEPTTSSNGLDRFLEGFAECRIDRERTEFLQKFIGDGDNWPIIEDPMFVETIIPEIRNLFDFPSTIERFRSWLKEFVEREDLPRKLVEQLKEMESKVAGR